jgi:hypothetical protein
LLAYHRFSQTADGRIILADLRRMLYVEHSIEPEVELTIEARAKGEVNAFIPIDDIAYKERNGGKKAYWKIIARIHAADLLIADMATTRRRTGVNDGGNA